MRDEAVLTHREFDLPATWYRNAEGTKVHRPECRYATTEWRHADGWSDHRAREAIATMAWLSACRVCFK